jgi:hypothetical protein
MENPAEWHINYLAALNSAKDEFNVLHIELEEKSLRYISLAGVIKHLSFLTNTLCPGNVELSERLHITTKKMRESYLKNKRS